VLAEWLDSHGDLFTYVPPDAGAITYVKYDHPINSTELVTELRERKSVLMVPGDHFGMDHYLRIGFGEDASYMRAGLSRVDALLAEIGAVTAA
jgi:aspartate/methionine/tyrosine aminotransferase